MGASRTKEKVRDGYLGDLPEEIKIKVMDIHKLIVKTVRDRLEDEEMYDDLKSSRWAMTCIDDFCTMPTDRSDVGSFRVYKNGKSHKCMIQITGHFTNHVYGWVEELLHDFINDVYSVVRPIIRKKYDMTTTNEGKVGNPFEGFDVYPTPKEAKIIWELMDDRKTKTITESANGGNVDKAKKAMYVLSKKLISDFSKGKNISQTAANLYANIITQDLIQPWTNGEYNQFIIVLGDHGNDNVLQFSMKSLDKKFVEDFIKGSKTIKDFTHAKSYIKVKMTPTIFNTMKSPDDAYKFFYDVVKYYSENVNAYSEKLMTEVMKLDHRWKHLIANTKLRGILSYPINVLFTFKNVSMNNASTFRISKDDINIICQFISNLNSRYKAPENEQKEIIKDVKEMVSKLKSVTAMEESTSEISFLGEALEELFFTEAFKDEMDKAHDEWMREQFDYEGMRNPKDPDVKYLLEKFGVKKLKRIPRDIVAYITIEGESIRDATDKMMIASYCLSKLEIVEWYIELIDTGSTKYIVPHDRPYLVSLRTQLLACYEKIMKMPIPNPANKPIIDIKYPKGYEG